MKCMQMKEISYNKKRMPSFDELGTIPLNYVLLQTYVVGIIFIKMIKITIIKGIMIEQRYLSDFLIIFLPLLFNFQKSKGIVSKLTKYSYINYTISKL